MSDKSIVSMGYALCPICYKEHDETVVLQARDITRPKLGRRTFTGFSLCPEHKAMAEEYVALVEVENTPASGDHLKPEAARPTGAIAHIRRSVVGQIIDTPIPASQPMVYVEKGVIAWLQSHVKVAGDDSQEGDAA